MFKEKHILIDNQFPEIVLIVHICCNAVFTFKRLLRFKLTEVKLTEPK